MRITPQTVHRMYGDELAVVLQVRTRSLLVLRAGALGLWRRLAADVEVVPRPDELALVRELAGLGILEGGQWAAPAGVVSEDSGVAAVPAHVLGYWAFRNSIPLGGHVSVTGRCGLRCGHCYLPAEGRGEGLSTGTLVRLADELRACGTLAVVLTGGEPFERPDLPELLREFSARNLALRVNTNGVRIGEREAVLLAELPTLFAVHVSLHGSCAEVHEAVTRTGGSFARTMAGLRLLREAGVPRRINCMVTRRNVADVERVRALAAELEAPVVFDAEVYPRDDGSTDNQCDALAPEERLRFAAAVGAGTQGGLGSEVCKAGQAFFSVDEEGDVYACPKLRRLGAGAVGSLREAGFGEIWRGAPGLVALRARLEERRAACARCGFELM